MAGKTLKEQGFQSEIIPNYISVKEAVLPFSRFQGVDPILGPEMKSTGEVMGIGRSFSEAYEKAQIASGARIPEKGTVFLSVRNSDQSNIAELAKEFQDLGFSIIATKGTSKNLASANIPFKLVNKVAEGRPHIVDLIKNGEIDIVVNSTEGRQSIIDSASIRRTALDQKVYCTTTVEGGKAVCSVLRNSENWRVISIQELHANIKS
jgi:carbamoyl-phosphate synthase large subunit